MDTLDDLIEHAEARLLSLQNKDHIPQGQYQKYHRALSEAEFTLRVLKNEKECQLGRNEQFQE